MSIPLLQSKGPVSLNGATSIGNVAKEYEKNLNPELASGYVTLHVKSVRFVYFVDLM